MDAQQLGEYATWRWLWTHTARQIMGRLALPANYDLVQIGYGWGLRSCNGQTALLLHPSGTGNDAGDLSLTILGQAARVLVREDQPYTDYIEYVADQVELALQNYLANHAADAPTIGEHNASAQ